MLLQNATILAQYPIARTGGLFCQERQLFGRNNRRNRFVNDQSNTRLKGGEPNGCLHPASWNLPVKSGGLSSNTAIIGNNTISPLTMAGGINGQSSISGTGDITSATGQLIVSAIANLTGSGTASSADLRGYLQAVAELSGSSSVSAALGAIAWANAALTGDGEITNATPYAKGVLSADIRGYSDLTPEGIRDKVWQSIIEAGFTAEQVMRLLASHAAGNATGLEGANPSFTGLDGSTTRIAGTYSGGTRTVTTRNGD